MGRWELFKYRLSAMRKAWRNPDCLQDVAALKMAMDRCYLTGEAYLLSVEPIKDHDGDTILLPKFQALGMTIEAAEVALS